MKTIDDGIVQLSKRRFAIRVPRVDIRTGKKTNRKATVDGTLGEAIAKRDELRAELAGAPAARAPMTLRAFAADWLERRRAHLKPSVSRRYEFALRHILAALGELELVAIAQADIERYLAARVRAGAAGSTAATELRILRTIARDAVAEGQSPRFWCDRVPLPVARRYSTERPNLLAAEEAGRVLARIPRQWLGLVFFMMTTGLRFGEASALRWIDIAGDVATIRRSNYRGREMTPKTESSYRDVPVLRAVRELWLGPAWRGPDADSGSLVFPARGGCMHRGSPLRSVLEKACAAAGAARITAHGLRRTFNDLARRRGSREVLKSITGHVTDAMVEHYSLVDAGEKATLSEAVAAAIGVPEVSDARTGDDASHDD